MSLPARLERRDPFWIGRFVAAQIHRRGSALEYISVLGVLADVRDALDCGRAGADDRDAFVPELVQITGGVAAGIFVIPPGRVKAMAFEAVNARDAGQLGLADTA